MLTVSAPWPAPGDDVPGALPMGIYVRVEDDGRELARVRLDAGDGPRWVSEGDDDTWSLGELVDAAALPDFVRAALGPGQTAAWLVDEIASRATWGISMTEDV